MLNRCLGESTSKHHENENTVANILMRNNTNYPVTYTVEPLYNTIVFHQNTHKRHPIARP